MMENIENIKVGDYITVLQGAKYDRETGSLFSPGGVTVEKQATEDGSYKGDVLEVVGLQYPFIVLKNHTDIGIFCEDHRVTLDCRKWKFMKLSDDFIRVALPKLIKGANHV